MANEDIQETTVVKRVEAIGSRNSSFYGLNNRLIVPLIYISIITTIPVSTKPIILLGVVIIAEIVIKFAFKTTLFDALRSLNRKLFGTKRKNVKN